MNRFTLPGASEDALLRRAEHHEAMGETSEALQYRRFAQNARRAKLEHSRISGRRREVL